ncbi:hypothetical protein JXQ70_00780 [bacterium]|nr:hypothetical protein [bacterium]
MRPYGKFFIIVILFGLQLVPSSGQGQDFTFSVDVPTSIAGSPMFLAYQTVYRTGGVYNLNFDGTLFGWTADVNINALAYLLDHSGDFVFSTDAPFLEPSSGSYYEPRDVVLFNQATGSFSAYLLGASIGLPADANIDALLFDGSGNLIASFDEPLTITGTPILPTDLVIINTGLLMPYILGSTLGLGASDNIIGADLDFAGNLLLCFDAPVSLAGVFALPGDIFLFSAGVFSLYFRDTSFPSGNAMTDFALDFVSPGRTPNGNDVTGTVLTITKSMTTLGNMDLSWGVSCLSTYTTYSVHEGTLGTGFYNHTNINCDTGGATSLSMTIPSTDRYYLIVPLNTQFEGSYGIDSSGTQRPVSTVPCRIYQYVTPCP